MMTPTRVLSSLLLVVCLGSSGLLFGSSSSAHAAATDTTNLSLLIAVPLTKKGGGGGGVKVPDPGWIQLASALLAVDQFNTRDSTIVPELSSSPLLADCNIRFGNITVLDTGTNDHVSMKDFTESAPPDAIAGPFNEIPALELSVFATSLQIPVVAHRATDPTLLDPKRHPFFTQVSADTYAEMDFLGSYLNHTGRHNYIAIVYASTATVMQKVDILKAILDQGSVDRQVKTFSFHSMKKDTSAANERQHDDSIQYALARVKETGFRTIVLLPDDIQTEGPELQAAATKFGLNQGQHLWVLSGGTAELSSQEQMDILAASNATYGQEENNNFLRGAAYLIPYDGFDFDYLNAFQTSLLHQNRSFVERLDQITPIPNYFDWKSLVNESTPYVLDTILDNVISWWQGTSYLFDATMSIGIGACEAAATANDTSNVPSGKELLEGIRSVDFTGASGRIVFKRDHNNNNNNVNKRGSTRVGKTIPMTVVNLLPPNNADELLVISEIRDPTTGEFLQLVPFVYADGSTDPPELLRDVPEQNYLDSGIRAAGLSLMVVALLVVLGSACWVFVHRYHSVVIAAMPIYLYALCLGSAIISLNIFFISPDESLGWTLDQLDKSCVAAVWVNAIGMLLVYGSIFTKHWRVHRFIHLKNKQLSFGLMVAPIILLVVAIIVLQALWTVADSYGWERTVIDEMSGESIGQCSGNVAPCLYFTGFFLFVPVALAGVFAYKTLGVDDLYSESKWVLVFILVQFQVYLVGAPVLQILRTVSTDGKFIGEALLIWTVPMSTMGLIIFPKIWLVRQMQQKADSASAKDDEANNNAQDSRGLTADRRPSNDTSGPSSDASADQPMPSPFSPLSGPRIQVVTFD